MKKVYLFLSALLLAISAFSQTEENEFPKLIFKGTLLSVSPTGKAHQSYIFTMKVDKVIEGKYKEKEISFECYAGNHGNDLLEYFNCIVDNADCIHSCSGKGKVVLVDRNFHGIRIFLFQSIEALD